MSKTPAFFEKLSYLQAVIENITDIVTILDGTGQVLYESPSITAVLGYTQEELVGRNVFTLVHPGDYTRVFSTFLRALSHKDAVEKLELRFRRKDGSWCILESFAKNLLFDPNVGAIVVSSRDISDRRAAEAQIRLQAEALKAASNGIVITDIKGTILWVNDAFCAMTGFSAEEAVGKNPRILKSGEQAPDVYRDLWQTVLSGRSWTGELINRRKNGTLYFEKQTVTPVKNAKNEITHFIAVKEDISSDKKLEAQFRQSQKMEAVGRLAGGVAHDFNNLLTVILGQTELMMMGRDASQPEHASLADIRNAGLRAAALTRQLLAFSRRQVLQAKVTDLNEIVRGIERMIRRLISEEIEPVVILGEGLPKVRVDAAQIEQVIMNLAVNARDAMPQGGKLVLETSAVRADDAMAARYAGLAPGPYVMLRVSDTGSGIPPEVRPHLFEPFYTTKEKGKGTGLGLATCYGIVKQSKGYIYAETGTAKGAAFFVLLPPAEEREAAAGGGEIAPELPRGTETILLAEDEELVRSLAVQVLRRQGYRVIEAANGLDALKSAEEHRGDPIRILITDMVMPFMGGNELAEKFSRSNPDAKIVFTSGYTDHSAVQKWIDAGCRFLQKPYSHGELVLTVREVLDG